MCGGISVLSRTSAHGRSQLKYQNFRVGGYTENVQGSTPDAKLAAMGPNRRRFVRDSSRHR